MKREHSNNEISREQARQILKSGICEMNIARFIQMPHLGLKGNIVLSDEAVTAESIFNRIGYDKERDVITFSIEEPLGGYGAISFPINAITEISGCEDEEYPEEYLNVNIKLKGGITINIKILY